MVASYPEADVGKEWMVGKKGCCQASFFGPQNQDGFITFELNTSDTNIERFVEACSIEKNMQKHTTISAKRSLVVV